jgi:hypothetical protein
MGQKEAGWQKEVASNATSRQATRESLSCQAKRTWQQGRHRDAGLGGGGQPLTCSSRHRPTREGRQTGVMDVGRQNQKQSCV